MHLTTTKYLYLVKKPLGYYLEFLIHWWGFYLVWLAQLIHGQVVGNVHMAG